MEGRCCGWCPGSGVAGGTSHRRKGRTAWHRWPWCWPTSRPATSAARADGAVCELGVDFAVEGGFAAADFASSVIGPLSWVQDRWERNLLHDVVPDAPGRAHDKTQCQEKLILGGFDNLTLPAPRLRRAYAFKQQQHLGIVKIAAGGTMPGDGPDGAGKVMPLGEKLLSLDLESIYLTRSRRATLCREALNYPVVFSEAVAPAALRDRAARAHLGRLLIHSRIDAGASLEKLQRTLAEFGERGTFGRADGSPPVRADLALCGPAGLLDGAFAAGAQQLASRLLWLVENAPGCELPGPSDDMRDLPAADFQAVCEREIRRRINFDDEAVHKLDALNGWMAGWRSFLREREWHHPGIAAALGNLPVALCYGLEAMDPSKSGVDGDEVLALAKWLVRRMSNRINMAAANGRDYRTERLAARLAEKLVKYGPMNVRGLMRKCSKLSAGDCRKGLALLAARGIVAEDNGVWGIPGDVPGVRDLVA